MANIDRYLKIASERRASDIHFSAGEPVRMRIDGDLVAVEAEAHANEGLQQILFEILSDQEREKCLTAKNLDKSYAIEGIGFFRVNIYWTRRGISAVLRTIPQKIPTLESLQLPPAAQKLSEAAKGLVLVTGPTGSGKSTTLAAMINYINVNFPYHILTAEDPVEFVHESKKSLINQREIGASCPTFADALKYALREDPDVILVGEMRDLETIGLALTAAETGHLVFGTLHTRGAGASVDRIIDSFPANQQAMIRTMLSESLIGVISQALLKRCDKPGRVAAFEIMMVNHAISNLIREGKTFQMTSIIQTGRKEGMILMDQHILELVDAGIVDPEEAAPYMEDDSLVKGKPSKGKAPAAAQPVIPTAPKAPPTATPAAPKVPPPQLKVVTPPPAPATVAPVATAAPVAAVVPAAPIAAVAPATPAPAPAKAFKSLDDVKEPTMEPVQEISAVTDLTNLPIDTAADDAALDPGPEPLVISEGDEFTQAIVVTEEETPEFEAPAVVPEGNPEEDHVATQLIDREVTQLAPRPPKMAAPGAPAPAKKPAPAPLAAPGAARKPAPAKPAPLKAAPPAAPAKPSAPPPAAATTNTPPAPPAVRKAGLPPPPPPKKKVG